MRLFEISNAYLAITEAIEEAEELTPDLMESLECVQGEMKDKIDNIASMIANMENICDGLDDIIERKQKKKKSLQNKIESLKAYVKSEMDRCEMKKIHTDHFDVSIRLNPPSVKIEDEAKIPEFYFKEELIRKLDKAFILQDLKNNAIIPGVFLEQKTRVQLS